MPENAKPAEPAAEKPAVPPKRHPGHRGQDVRDTVAEMAAKAHEISLEAGSKMAAAMKEVVGAAAGLSAFAIESARDLVQYMVRRGQMTQDEADKLIVVAEEAWLKQNKGKSLPKPGVSLAPVKSALPKPPVAQPVQTLLKPIVRASAVKKAAAAPAAAKKAAPAKKAAAPAKKAATKKPAPKK